jgi:hypothetical protein
MLVGDLLDFLVAGGVGTIETSSYSYEIKFTK